ncbi:hypothetical protein ACA910_016940 [Epithemia clementina (nom. ined.)]
MLHDEARWRCLWTRAFPSLFPALVQSDADDNIWEKYLAWRTIWHYHDKPHTVHDASIAFDDAIEDETAKNYVDGDEWHGSMGYGEITPESVLKVFDIIERSRGGDLRWGKSTVTDLGSGRGIVLLVILTAYPVVKVTGIELNNNLHLEALENYRHWKRANQRLRQVDVDWRHGDFTVDTDWVDTTDLVICHATLFEDALMSRLTYLCSLCGSGTMFVMVSRPLQHPSIVTINTLQLEMSWGRSTVYLQVRLWHCPVII